MTRQAMRCDELSTALSQQGLADLPEQSRVAASSHLATCAGCRQLLETVEGFQLVPVPRPQFSPPDLAPVLPMPSQVEFAALACFLPLVIVGLGVLWKGVYGWPQLGTGTQALFGALAISAVAATVWALYRQFKPGAGESWDGRLAAIVTLGGFAAFAVAMGSGWHPESGGGARVAWSCFRFGAIVATGSALGLFALTRRGFAANPDSASFWIGGLASVSGVIALTLHCPVHELSHLLFGHATVIAAGGVVIALAARQVLVRH